MGRLTGAGMPFMAIICAIIAAIASIYLITTIEMNPLYLGVKQDAFTVEELREISRDCGKIYRNYPSIETIYNAPVGQPRKPIKWVITCKTMK